MENLSNDFTTTLASAIVNAVTIAINVAPGAGGPPANFRIRIDDELMLVTSKGSGTDWTVTRGVEGTTPTSHLADSVVYHVLTAGALEAKFEEVRASATLQSGTNTGDFVRYNAATDTWEVAAEPLALKGLVLTPADSSLVTAEGALYYNSSEKAIKVCTDAI